MAYVKYELAKGYLALADLNGDKIPNVQRAIRAYEESATIWKNLGDWQRQAAILTGLVHLYRTLSLNKVDPKKHYQFAANTTRALAIIFKDHGPRDKYIETRNELAHLLLTIAGMGIAPPQNLRCLV